VAIGCILGCYLLQECGIGISEYIRAETGASGVHSTGAELFKSHVRSLACLEAQLSTAPRGFIYASVFKERAFIIRSNLVHDLWSR